MSQYLLPRFACVLFISFAQIVAAGETQSTVETARQLEHRWQESGWTLVQKYCLECHNSKTQEAELDLSSMKDDATAPANMMMWNRVLQMVRFGAMPPDDAPSPTEQERRMLVTAIDRSLFRVSCDLRPKSGRVTARRLNRTEYGNTIRDLFGLDFNVTDDFPADEVGGGFDNNADVLSMPPLLLEKYIESAERVAALAILDPKELKSTEQERSGDGIGVVGRSVTESFYGRVLANKDAFAWVEFDVVQAGKYRVRIQGGAWNPKQEPQAYAVYDQRGAPVFADQFKKAKVGGGDSATFSLELEVGKHFFIVAPLERLPDRFEEQRLESLGKFTLLEKLDENAIRAGREQSGKPLNVDSETHADDLGLMVRRVAIEGPTEFTKAKYPHSHTMILRTIPPSRDGRYRDVDEAAAECLKPLMAMMFRGSVDDESVQRYAALVKDATRRGDSFERGMQIALTALLVSPRFLFRVEIPEDGATPDTDGDYRLSSLQLASRLSFFLWSSTPDETLLQVARENKLLDQQVLLGEVDRMLADNRSRSLATEFAAQWLGLRNLRNTERDNERFPRFNAALMASMSEETRRLFLHILRENRPVGELLDADYTFIDSSLASYYGLAWDESNRTGRTNDPFQRVSLASSPRRGVLTHASVLTLTSYPTRTSPVQRGKWILENVLGTPPPDPPPNVPELAATKVAAGTSIRDQLAAHRDNPACASCHRVMDQLGFGFEQFDAVGQFRSDPKIDASGELPGGRKFVGGQQLAGILRTTESSRFALTATEKLLGFALGRELSPDDRCITDKIVTENQPTDYRLADLVKSVVLSRPFQYFQPESLPLANDKSKPETVK